MLNKLLIITLLDGTEITRDITLEKIIDIDGKPIPIGSPANHMGYALLCRHMASGFMDKCTNEKHAKWIAAGDIKSVEVKFLNKNKN